MHLFTILLTAAVGIISGGIGSLMGYSFGNGSDIIDSPLSNLMDNAAIVVELVLWIPNLSLSVRRLHDEDRRGWGCVCLAAALLPLQGWWITGGTALVTVFWQSVTCSPNASRSLYHWLIPYWMLSDSRCCNQHRWVAALFGV